MGILSKIGKSIAEIAALPVVTATRAISGAIEGTKTLISGGSLKEAEAAAKPYTAANSISIAKTAGTAAAIAAAPYVAPVVAKVGIIKSAAIAAGATIAGSALYTSEKAREKAAEAVLSAPSSLVNVGKNVGEFIEDPSLQKAKDIITENPLIVGGVAAGVIGSAALAAAPLISGALTRSEMQKQTEAFERQAEAAEQLLQGVNALSGGNNQLVAEKPIQTGGEVPQTQAVTTISTGTRRRRRTIKQTPSINQRVNVVVQNKATSTGVRVRNERLIKGGVYA